MTQQIPTRDQILRGLAPGNLIQPATVLWRVYELEAIYRYARLAGRIMDLGCGDGTLTKTILGTEHSEVIGIEPDPQDASDARVSGVYKRVHVAPGDAVPEPAGSFDTIFSNSVLEHIPAIEPVLAESSRLLRPLGQFVLTVPSEQFHACLRGNPETVDRRLQHHRYWSPEEWRSVLGAVDLTVQSVQRYFPRRAVWAWERLSSLTGGLAFELLGRRQETRQIQRNLWLARIQRRVPDSLSIAVLRGLLRRHLSYSQDEAGEPSGGLLVVAIRQ